MYFSSLGDHKAAEGDAYVYAYNSEKDQLRLLVDFRSLLQLPAGWYSPGKIHSRIDMGSDGWLYFVTHRGSARVTVPAEGCTMELPLCSMT